MKFEYIQFNDCSVKNIKNLNVKNNKIFIYKLIQSSIINLVLRSEIFIHYNNKKNTFDEFKDAFPEHEYSLL